MSYVIDLQAGVTGAGYTALMKAAVWGHLAIVKKLADAGASCIASNIDGATPLMMARAANHASLVAWLQQEVSHHAL